jgi:type I restriction enzyme S subunit
MTSNKKLDSSIEVISGYAFSSEFFSNKRGTGLPLVRIRDLEAQDPKTYFTSVYDPLYVVNRGDILIGMDGDFNAVRWHGPRALLNQRVCKVYSTSHYLHNGYLYHWLQPKLNKIHQQTPQTTVRHLSTKDILQIQIPFFPFQQQRRIARILDTADAAIRETERVIAKLREVKQGLLHDLLTRGLDAHGHLRDPKAHPEQFKDSPLGRIPRAWEVKILESCTSAKITYGIVQAGPHIKDGVPYIRTGDISDGRLSSAENLLRTSEEIAASYKRSEVHTGEIVCAIRATVGQVVEVPAELDGANLTQGTARIAPQSDINNRFLLWMLRSNAVQRQFDIAVKGTTFREITLGALRRLEVALPTNRGEQDEIARILDAHDARIRAEEAVLAKRRQVKRGLMDDLLTGRVRV